MKVELVRFAYCADVTLGWLNVGTLKLATLEEPWSPDPDVPGGQRREIGKRESCVPDGAYQLHVHNGTKWRGVWCLENRALGVYRQPADIPQGQKYGRSAILIHSGVDTNSILGCILVGMGHGRVNSGAFVTESIKALDALRAVLSGGTHQLQIRPRAGTAEVL